MKNILRLIFLFLFSLNFFCVFSQERGKVFPNPESVKPLPEGSKIPDLEARQIDGSMVSLSSFIKKMPTVLVFYRGGWCPYCSKQLAGLQEIERSLLKAGFQIIAMSPDKPEELEKIAHTLSLKYRLLSDSKLIIASHFGLAYKIAKKTLKQNEGFFEQYSGEKTGMLPVPAVFLIDQKGIIKFRFFNPDYQVRLDEKTLLEEAQKMMK